MSTDGQTGNLDQNDDGNSDKICVNLGFSANFGN